MVRRVATILSLAVATVLLCDSCSTGVENVPEITTRDVQRHFHHIGERPQSSLLPYRDSIACWKNGKQFYVADNQFKHLVSLTSTLDPDTLNLGGSVVVFNGFSTLRKLDGSETLSLCFSSNQGPLVIDTGRERSAITAQYSVPFLIDLDMVGHYARQLVGNSYYITTPLWIDRESLEIIKGRKYVPVTVDSVLPGDKVFPLRVLFTDKETGQHAMLWMTAGPTTITGRDFDSSFSVTDPYQGYKHIARDTWQLIIVGKVKNGMTKEECRLAMGPPREVSRMPDHDGVHELWHYSGVTLRFDDGVLTEMR